MERQPQVAVSATVDHIEVGPNHLILGLNLDCQNRSDEPLSIVDMQAKLYRRHDTRGIAPNTVLDDLVEAKILLHLLPLENFARQPGLKPFKKKPLSYFSLSPRTTHTVHIRLVCHQGYNIQPGIYTVDITLQDASHNRYTRRTKIHVENKMKYRTSADWNDLSKPR